MTETHSRSRGQRAQALAEMAVMVPFLVIGMMGMLDLGRAFYYQIAITNAVREGARYAVQPYYLGLNPTCATIPPAPNPGPNCVTPGDGAIQARVNQELNGTGIAIPSSDIRVSPDQAARVTYYNGATPTSQYPVTVSASFKFYFITPIIGSLIGDPLTINTSSVFRADY
ncbi:MAG TPA: TadE/TadG family type IV pilus assembly protein [Mycobacterium sp.]|nr:TadE/TadG family type IV pilus assembly protein [Mycobacterium sp.]